MIFIKPEYRVGNQEVSDLVSAIIENMGTPFKVLANTLVLIFIRGGTVKPRKSVAVLPENAPEPSQE